MTRPLDHLRPRSTAAVVTTRSDSPLRPNVVHAPSDGSPDPQPPPGRWHRIGTIVTWVLLGLLIAALWASVLNGLRR